MRSDCDSFLSLLHAHAELHEALDAHREALLSLDLTGAEARLTEFGAALRHHMCEEEELLLPIYARADEGPGGRVEIFLKEHGKLFHFLGRIEEAMWSLRAVGPDTQSHVFELLDYEARFKNLLIHHDERERNILYPTLDRLATEEERRSILVTFSRLPRQMFSSPPT
jgi:hemerythrin-like domain-containing protein